MTQHALCSNWLKELRYILLYFPCQLADREKPSVHGRNLHLATVLASWDWDILHLTSSDCTGRDGGGGGVSSSITVSVFSVPPPPPSPTAAKKSFRIKGPWTGAFAETANVGYLTSFTDQGKQTSIFYFRLQYWRLEDFRFNETVMTGDPLD
jgi:hypothetical protein